MRTGKKSLAALVIAGAAATGLLSAPGAQAASATLYQAESFAGLCLELRPADRALVQTDCTGTAEQQFEFVSAGGGAYEIRELGTGHCLDVKDASTAADAPVVGAPCGGQPNQRFQPVSGAEGYVIHTFAGQCLDVKGGSEAAGAPIVQSECQLAKESQQFAIEVLQP
ncbi:RICIN domain-containing protein [Streptomyces sp. NPDC058953]|uniref:RICIN domain-containing protein n=1 Tax=unclassified Streptomyces TaxID=2593676 RepID=UPI0036AABACD